MTRKTSLEHGKRPEKTDVRVSVVVPARNERNTLPVLIEAIERQTLAPFEVLVADGESDDGTRAWLIEAGRTRPWLRTVDNPQRTISHGMNAAIAQASGDIVARMDTHAIYAPDYLAEVVSVFQSHPEVVAVGGAMATEGKGPWGRAIASVLSRPFGLVGAKHRVGGEGGPVDHAFSPAYRRTAVQDAGGFDPAFLANEDFELDQRLRKNGGVVWLHTGAKCTWFVRESPKALAKQMFNYGFFKARTLRVHPDSLRMRQLAPPVLIALLASITLVNRRAGLATTTAYLGAAGGLGARAARADQTSAWRAAVAVPVVHLGWGAGFYAGLVKHRRATAVEAPFHER